MLVLITYDVNTSDAAGRGRLRRIAKECVNYGQRVQNSVFECLLDTAQCRKLQNELCKIIDPEKDSLRFYYLGKKYENKIEHFGCKQTYLLKFVCYRKNVHSDLYTFAVAPRKGRVG